MTPQTVSKTYGGNPAANYERYFVPAIGRPIAQDLIHAAQLRPGERVLDVACGTGIVARLAAERTSPGGAVAAVDVLPSMLEVARATDPASTVDWQQASAESLPLPDRSFDVVLCQMGLQFFSDRTAAVREMRRVLVPGGRVLANVPGPTPAPLEVLERKLAACVGAEAAAFVHAVFALHDPQDIAGLLRDAGLDRVEAHAETKRLELPAPADFLWQYVYSTPLAEAAGRLDEATSRELEREVVAAWRPFVSDGGMVVDVGVTTATAAR